MPHLRRQSARKHHKTINDLVKFHPIRGSWDFNEKVLEEDCDDEGETIAMDAKDVKATGTEVENIGVGEAATDVEEVDVEDVEVVGGIGRVCGDDALIPSSPVLSDLADRSLPPTSDGSIELVDDADVEVEGMEEWPTLKRKRSSGVGDREKSGKKAVRMGETGMMSDGESGTGTDDGEKRRRSAAASRRLKELAKSGDFVPDERKKKRFEDKCIEMDSGARFRYRDSSWQVLHSKCLKWYVMSEPYNLTKFRLHLGTCKSRGEKGNIPITSFFKPRDQGGANTEAKTKITASGRKQIFIGGSASISTTTKPSHTTNEITVQSQPCCGISDVDNPLVSPYISRTVVEGAGSISLDKATKMVYGDNVKYAELTDKQKEAVTATQSHLRTWSINRELRVVFSTNCAKFVEQDRFPKTTCHSCERVVRSDAFKRALRVKPTPLERMKYIPVKYRGPLEDLGAKFAGTRGLSELLQDVSFADLVITSFTVSNAKQDPQTSMWVRFTRGVIRGKYDDNLVFLGMIQATMMAHDRESHGVGLQNMSYLPIYEEFAQMVALTSPRTYRLFAPHIQLPSLRRHR